MRGSTSRASNDLLEMPSPKWEMVGADSYSTTYRCRVPSGWLVSQQFDERMLRGSAAPPEPYTVFVPDKGNRFGWDVLASLFQITLGLSYGGFLLWLLLRLFGAA